MRSDEEIERQLEEWLEDEAQPMPQEVLENTLKSVARTTQADRGTGASWVRSGSLGALAAAAVLVLAVVAGVLVRDRIGSGPDESASAEPGQAWAQPSDFEAAPAANPGPDGPGHPDVWSYFSSPTTHAPDTYELLPTYMSNEWTDRRFINLHVNLDRGLVLHPFASETEGVRYIILGWKSPIAGEVTISGSADLLQRTCPQAADGVVLSIDHGSQTVATREIAAGGTATYELTVTIQLGDSIFFVVDPTVNSNCDSTALNFTISTASR